MVGWRAAAILALALPLISRCGLCEETPSPGATVRPGAHTARLAVPGRLTRAKALRQVPAIHPGAYFVPPQLSEVPNTKYGEMVLMGRDIFCRYPNPCAALCWQWLELRELPFERGAQALLGATLGGFSPVSF